MSEVEVKREWWRIAIAIGFWIAVLSVIGFGVHKAYSHLQRKRTLRKAQTFLDSRDYKNSDYWVKRSLEIDPDNVEAYRISAKAREADGSVTALIYWRRVVEVEPDVPENHFALARAALRFHKPAVAEQALAGVSEAGKNTAAYHELRASLAEDSHDLKKAEAELAEALKIDPQNQRCQLRIAALQLQSEDPQVRDAARTIVEKFIANPELRRMASEALLGDALSRGRGVRAITLARSLAAGPDSTFEDRIGYLKILRQFNHPAFSRQLLRLEDESAGDPKRAATLVSWMNANGLTLLASDWAKRLPEETRASGVVQAAMADSYAALGDWDAVKKLVMDGKWGALDFSRLMLRARVMRLQGDESGWNESWTAAVKAAGDRRDVLAVLAANASAWGWESEAENVLWAAANRATNPQWALDALRQKYTASGNTRALLRVATRQHEVQPDDRDAENTLTTLNLLLNTNMKEAMAMAEDAFRAEPKNPSYAAAYAFALHLHGHTDQGLKIMGAFDKKQLERPEIALYYGSMLAATGAADEARKYLDLADGGNLLPEEKEMISRARKQSAAASAQEEAVGH